MAPSRTLRSLFVVYWAAFALLAARQGQFPGLMLHPEQWRYPYFGVFSICVLLAALLAVLYFILRPAMFPYSWLRLLTAMAYAGALLALGISCFATDLPGHLYVPVIFAATTVLCLFVLALVSVDLAWRSGRKRAA